MDHVYNQNANSFKPLSQETITLDFFFDVVSKPPIEEARAMKKAILDLTDCQRFDELHERIQKALDFPAYYGKSTDAFWDCISSDCDADFVSVIGSKSVAEDLMPTVRQMLEMLEENKQLWANSQTPFDYEVIS